MNNQMMNRPVSGIAMYQESKELSEIKGKMFLARQFPRDPDYAMNMVLRECKRKELAEAATYEFPRGDSVVKGPSIRLVEVLARNWGNINYGVTEVDTTGDTTTIKAFAWDLQTNVADEKTFTVKHERSTKNGSYKLTDERDIYEAVANKGARRKRACLLSVLPGWYVDAALAACEATLTASMTADGKSMGDVISSMVSAFGEFGINPDQISAKLGKDIGNLSKNDVVKLRNLYSAIKDGFVKAGDAFGVAPTPSPELPSSSEEEALNTLNQQLTMGGMGNGAYQR